MLLVEGAKNAGKRRRILDVSVYATGHRFEHL